MQAKFWPAVISVGELWYYSVSGGGERAVGLFGGARLPNVR
jgi:hypothetical protein